MRNILDVWRAGRVRRWHMDPDLSWTIDFTDGHGARVARIVLALDPEARGRVLAAALTHDDGEACFGDLSRPAKDALGSDAATSLEQSEAEARRVLWGTDYVSGLTAAEQTLLSLADRLDAWLWVRAHMPHLLTGRAWSGSAAAILSRAEALGFGAVVAPLLQTRRPRQPDWRGAMSSWVRRLVQG